MNAPVLMFVSSSDYGALLAKGVTGMIAERSEGGFFQRVISFHPLARKTRVLPIAPRHDLVELGFDAFPGGARWRVLRYIFAPFCVLRAIITARRLVRSERVDIVRSSDPFVSGLIGFLAARASGAAFCVSLHADYGRLENRDVIARMPSADVLAKFILRQADVVAPISEYLAHKARQIGVCNSRIHVIHHGIDTSLFDGVCRQGTRALFGLPDVAPVVLYVNRLSDQKFCWDALEIANQLQTEGVVTVFCGDGPERSAMERRAEANPKLAGRVHFLGFQPRETIAALAAEADVGLVLLAGFGLIELCAAGLPAVVYRMEWQEEIIEHERNGLVVPEGDIDAAAAAVDRLLADKVLARSLGEEAQRRVREGFSLEAAKVRRVKAYDAALASRQGRLCGERDQEKTPT